MKSVYKIIVTLAFLVFSATAHAETVTESDLVGEWQCESVLHGSMHKQGGFVDGWQVDADALTVSLASTLTFANAGGGAYQLTSTQPNPVNVYSTEALRTPYKIKGGEILAFTYFPEGTNYLYEIRKVSESRFSFYPVAAGFHPVVSCEKILPLSAVTSTEPVVMGDGM